MSPLSVAIIGCPNVGKSTLFNRMVQRHTALVDRTAGVTRDRHYGEAEWLGRSFQVIDTGGIVTGQASGLMHAIRKQTECAIAEAGLILFVVDARQGVTSGDQEIALQLHKTGMLVNHHSLTVFLANIVFWSTMYQGQRGIRLIA